MKLGKTAILIYVIIGFAIIGLLSQLIGNTIGFLVNILIMIVFAAAVFGILYYIFYNRNTTQGSDEMSKYKKAVKQSKMKYQQSSAPKNISSTKSKNNKPTLRKNRKRPSHLRVIEGNKSKDKDKDQATN